VETLGTQRLSQLQNYLQDKFPLFSFLQKRKKGDRSINIQNLFHLCAENGKQVKAAALGE
jgi:hypothetical protein